MKWGIVALVLLGCMLMPGRALAQQTGSIPLLALVEEGNATSGGIATLSLEIRPGTGRVFVDTFPLTKIATQISMRFAQQVACKEIDVDCTRYDFIYTIQATPGVVGGPSAGAAAAVLTAALLREDKIKEGIAITGTVNSGGFIGPVGGVLQKIEGAREHGITTVIVPRDGSLDVIDNSTVTAEIYGEGLGVKVHEVSSLSEALEIFTGEPSREGSIEVQHDRSYEETMQTITAQLCNRAKRLYREAEFGQNRTDELRNLTTESDRLLNDEKFYSAASMCFRGNVIARTELYKQRNLNRGEREKLVEAISESLLEFEDEVDLTEIKTITDLQAIMIVKERLLEAHDALEAAQLNIADQDVSVTNIAFAEERLASARSWALFLGQSGRPFHIDERTMQESCQKKIEEAEERYFYALSTLPGSYVGSRESIQQAYTYFNQGRYELCFFKASQAKAQFDVVLSVLGVEGRNIDQVITTKLDLSKYAIASAQSKEIFPILAYSYYEYAEVLRRTDPATAILFAEYALELSNVDIYFDKKNGVLDTSVDQLDIPRYFVHIVVFVLGIALGLILPRKWKSS